MLAEFWAFPLQSYIDDVSTEVCFHLRCGCSPSECDIRENFDTNECPNIFVPPKLHEWISEYIHTNFFDTNECPNKNSYWKLHEYSNIFEYSSRFYTLERMEK